MRNKIRTRKKVRRVQILETDGCEYRLYWCSYDMLIMRCH